MSLPASPKAEGTFFPLLFLLLLILQACSPNVFLNAYFYVCFRCRRPLEPGLKLVITLRFLASGSSFRSLCFNFRVPHNTICGFIPEVCQAIYDEYQEELFNVPTTPDGWKEVADKFRSRWNFHHTCGAVDGKHVAIKKPKGSGSLYFNYKGFCSIILLAVVDAQYKFLWANVGAKRISL